MPFHAPIHQGLPWDRAATSSTPNGTRLRRRPTTAEVGDGRCARGRSWSPAWSPRSSPRCGGATRRRVTSVGPSTPRRAASRPQWDRCCNGTWTSSPSRRPWSGRPRACRTSSSRSGSRRSAWPSGTRGGSGSATSSRSRRATWPHSSRGWRRTRYRTWPRPARSTSSRLALDPSTASSGTGSTGARPISSRRPSTSATPGTFPASGRPRPPRQRATQRTGASPSPSAPLPDSRGSRCSLPCTPRVRLRSRSRGGGWR